ncbi:MAG: caspase family protein [Myxococcales bacterium]|nr:caspase family protein [Myxococcales bacterium]
MRRLAALLAALALVLVALAPALASAAVVRYAVLIGNNEGAADEGALRYAERDATRVAEVLRALGGFHDENTVVLLGRDADALRRVLISINDRIRSATRGADQAVLLVYYSGHADADALHLGDERLELEQLRQLVRGSSADFRMLLLDACRSGALTRVKGARPAPTFDVALEERLRGEGLVFLTSSSANEDAQESDALRGSFFTHYLVSGLVGAADGDGDGDITLAEAYRYAYEHTVRASSRTLQGTQHPTFEFDVRGQGGVTLTQVASVARGRARLRFPTGRTYLVFAGGPEGAVVSEVGAHDVARVVNVKAGRYFVRGRARDHLLEGTITVASQTTRTVDDGSLKRVEYARLARKGGGARAVAHGPVLGYQLRTALTPGSSLCHGARVGWSAETRWVGVAATFGFCRAGFDADRLVVTADDYDLDAAVTHSFDLPIVSLALGLGGGVNLLRQSFETAGFAPPRTTVAGHVSALLALQWGLPRGFYLITSVAAQVTFFPLQRGNDERASVTAALGVRPLFGVGKWF